MDFVDYRNSKEKQQQVQEEARPNRGRLRGSMFNDYIEEIINEARERGAFDNLQGTGKPLNLEEESLAGDKALAYHMLKNSGSAPSEIEMLKEIRHQQARIDEKLAKVIHQGKSLRARRVPPFASEKRAYNTTATKALAEYEKTLRDLNRKIMILNLSTPAIMHQTPLEVEKLVQQAREACPLFEREA